MNTADLREYVYRKSMELLEIPLTRDETSLFLNIVMAGIVYGLTQTEEKKVNLRSFGKFERVQRKGRTYKVRGTEVTVPNRFTVVFRPGTKLKREIKSD